MNELRSLFPHQLRRFLVCGALGCLVPVQVMAYVGNMPTRLDRFNTWSNGNVVTTKYAHDAAVGAIRHAQKSAVSGTATTGGVNLAKQIGINTKNGVVTATATQRISARQIAKGIGALASGPAGWALIGVPLILDLLDDAGLDVQADGTVNIDTVTYGYQRTGSGFPIRTTILQVCHDIMGSTLATNGFFRNVIESYPTYDSISIGCAWPALPGGNTYGAIRWKTTGSQPASPEQIEDALTNANPSPGVLKELGDNGITPDPDPADQTVITAPQPSPTKTSTKTNPDGSTETTECETIGLLEAGNIRLVEECSVTLRDPSGNVTSTTNTTTDQADPVPQEEEQSLFCELFPKVLACAEFGEPEGDEIPTEERSVDFEPELLFGNGSCPADTSITVNGTTITIGQWSSWCPYLTDYVRPMVLLLSAFMALMIVARGMPE